VICFTPEQEYFAKGTHGITGRWTIPELSSAEPNNFMTKLFEQARENIAKEKDLYAPQREIYDAAMVEIRKIIDGVIDAESANQAVEAIQQLDHALTSKKEASALLTAKTGSLGLKYTKEGYVYVPKEG
jgi:hypothetical protein